MKPRMLIVIIVLGLAALACNAPTAATTPTLSPEPGTPSVLTLAVQTAQALQTLTPPTAAPTPRDTLIPPLPTNTRAPDVPTATQAVACDQAVFVQDVSIPDGTRLGPNQPFTKIWRLKNTGTCTWGSGYAIVFAGGEALGAPAVINLPGSVPPEATVDLTIEMKAPAAPGSYESNWKLRNAAGVVFGVYANQPFFVQIEVVALTPTTTITPTITVTPTVTLTRTATQPPAGSGVIYDFTANFCQADWRSLAGELNCPGINNDLWGYALRLQNQVLENGGTQPGPVLLTVPNSTKDGAITGSFPLMTIQQGYRFRASLGCISGSSQCAVKYQVNYTLAGANPVNLVEVAKTYTGILETVDVDLSSLAGKQVQIALVVLANGSAEGDQATWINPRIEKP